MNNDWERRAQGALKAELALRNVTYKQLSILLKGIGVEDSHTAIANRISRGKFSFAFFLMCMEALGATEVRIKI